MRLGGEYAYLFLLSRSRQYFFDQSAIKEPVAASSITRLAQKIDDQAGSDPVAC